MKQILMAFAAALVSSTFALADTPVTPAEGEKIKAALEAFGCTGGKMEKETEGSGYFEVDDAKCNGRPVRHQARQGLQVNLDDPRLTPREEAPESALISAIECAQQSCDLN